MDEIKGGDTPEERPSEDSASSSSGSPSGGPPRGETPKKESPEGAPSGETPSESAPSESSNTSEADKGPGEEAAGAAGDSAAGDGSASPEEPKTPTDSSETPSLDSTSPESSSGLPADSPAGDVSDASSDSEGKTEEPGEKPIHYPEDPDEDYSAYPSSLMPPKEKLEGGSSQPPAAPAPPPPPPPDGDDADFGEDDDDDDGDDEEDGMLRMSFMDHLEELRSRLISIVIGGGVAFLLAVLISYPLWNWVQAPLRNAVEVANGRIIAITPMEQFTIIWMWSPLVAAIYMAAPWVIYQIWAFVAPGLYPNERKWAGPFILVTAGLFVSGGLFAYYIAFPMALQFLLTIGSDVGVEPDITIDSYFSLFVNVMLGVSVLFLMPVAVFFLTLLRITTPGFLMRNARYAVLIIVILAAVITPTPDPVNLTLFAVPMILLFFLGVFASYLLVLHREGQRFPWKAFFIWLLALLVLVAIGVALAIIYFDYRIVLAWPPLVR